jgi:iron only hydrogenase large subunit-like protein
VGAEAFSSDLTDGQMVMTLQGSDVEVTINGTGVFINNAQVTVADLEAENGVVHVINAVLLPGSVGIEAANNGFEVYPNPAEDQVVITFTTEQNIQQVNILDANGRLVNQQVAGNQNVSKLVLNVSELPTGLYFVEVISAAGRNIQKLSVR